MYAYNTPENTPVKVKFVFQMTGPSDFEPSKWGAKDNQSKAEFASTMTGKDITADMIEDGTYIKYVEEISPYYYFNENTIPSILAYGSKDLIVPPSVKEKMLEALDKYGVTYKYIEFPNSGHGMMYDDDKMHEYLKEVDDFSDIYFEK